MTHHSFVFSANVRLWFFNAMKSISRIRLANRLFACIAVSMLIGFGLIRIGSARIEQTLMFTAPAPYNVGAGASQPYSVAAFNKFGKPALAVTNNVGNSVSVLYATYLNGQYNGSFGSASTYSLVTPGVSNPAPQQIVVGNLGQLGIPCLVIAASAANKVAVLLGNSDDTFQSTPTYYDVGVFPESVTLGDFDGNGILDIAAANYGSSTVSILLGNSDRTFQTPALTFNVSAQPESIVAGDFNGDGSVDIATASSGTNPGKVTVLFGLGNGSFQQPGSTYNVGSNPFSLAAADFNADGKLDIVTANHSGGASVLLNNGNGTFPATGTLYTAGSGPYSVAVADFNLDGSPDVLITNASDGTVSVLVNNSNGTFQNATPATTFPTGSAPFFGAVGDFNVDGKPDVAVPNAVSNPGTISVLLNTTGPFSVPPANDNFASATTLTGISGSTLGTSIGATHENQEPNHAGLNGMASVWYNWTAPANGNMTFDTFGSTFDTVLAVYTGSNVTALTLIGSNNDDHGTAGDVRNDSRVSFTALAGTTYHIVVDGNGNAIGNITLDWYLQPPPANDFFAAAQIISGASGAVGATNAGATKEQNEPNHAGNAGGASLWYQWTPPSDGTVTFTTSGSFLDTLLAVYTGSLGNLALVAQNDDESPPQTLTSRLSFTANHLTTYFIAVDGKNGATNNLLLSWGLGNVPNEDFNQAQVLTGGSGTVQGPNPNGLWYVWTAQSSGGFFFSSTAFRNATRSTSQLPSRVTVYTGTTPGMLTTIGTNTGQCQGFQDLFCANARVDFNAITGVTYHVLVDSPFGSSASGGFTLTWGTSSGAGTPAPANDNFINASPITSFGGSTNGTLIGATLEPGEPNSGGTSVWFNWTPSRNVSVQFISTSTCQVGQGIQSATSIGVFTGTNFANFVEVAPSTPGNCDFNGNSTPAFVAFAAVQGTTYHISVDKVPELATPPSYTLNWTPSSAPLNDAFLNAQSISGQSGSVEGFTTNSHSETNEPNHGLSGSFFSVWYTWVAVSNGFVTFSCINVSPAANVVAVYVGNNLVTLSPVVAGRVRFYAVAGTTYRIAVASNGTVGAFRLNWGSPARIRGRISDIRGVGIANVPVALSGDSPGSQTTDAQGNYSFTDLILGKNYTVTPAIASYTYDVANHTYNPLPSDITDANFVAQTPTYNISGRLTQNGVGIDNIMVNLTGNTTESQATVNGGFFSFLFLPIRGNYTVTPTSPMYTFNAVVFPSLHALTYLNLNNDVSNADFIATGPTAAPASISGQVLRGNGTPVSGTTITLTGNNRLVRAITDSNGFYRITNLETGDLYSLRPSRANYLFTPGERSFSLLADKTDAVFTAEPLGPNANPLDSPEFFVRQHYLDFLAREPEQGGLDYWSAQLRSCGTDDLCVQRRRVEVSAAFFIEQEFQQTGLFIYNLYRGGLGRQPAYVEYVRDRQQVIAGANLATEQQAFAEAFVMRGEFLQRYANSIDGPAFIDQLISNLWQTSGVDLNSSREDLLNVYGSGHNQSESRSLVLRNVVENHAFRDKEYNSAFVLMEYFGYLQREPDSGGYHFWLEVLNGPARNNYLSMVCAFITSPEYQQRFSPVITHGNYECR